MLLALRSLYEGAPGPPPPDTQGGTSGFLTRVRKLRHYGYYDTGEKLPRHIEQLVGIRGDKEDDDEIALLLILHAFLE